MNFTKTKLILFSFLLVTLLFTSCKNDDSTIKITDNTTQSIAVKTSMSNLSNHFNDNGTINQTQNPVDNIIFDFCFEFVYPVTLSYSNGSEVVIENLDNLITVLTGMTNDLYIDGIAFPFQVETHVNGAIEIQTINNEDEFIDLLDSCGFDQDGNFEDCNCTSEYEPVCVELQDPNGASFIMEFPNFCLAQCEGFTQEDIVDCDNSNPANDNFNECFDFVFPFSIVDLDGNITVINNETELEIAFFSNYIFDFVYPFEIVIDNDMLFVINNFEELIANINAYCNVDPCNCTTEFDPVCVLGPNGNEIHYSNTCLAECDGFTENDFIDCVNDDCEISNINTSVICLSETTYQLVLNFNVANSTTNEFMVFSENGLTGPYNVSDLPIEFNFEGLLNPNGAISELQIQMLDAADCLDNVSWSIPNCSNNTDCEDNCPQDVNPVCIEVNGDIIEFINYCYAECAGYTQEDLVDCDPDEPCEISNITIETQCTAETAYTVTLDFDVQNSLTNEFIVTSENGQSGPYSINDLPMVFAFESNSSNNGAMSELIIEMLGENCIGKSLWEIPNCANNTCEDACLQDGPIVCVESNGQIIEFGSPCLAECAGYTEDDFVDCDPNNDCIIDNLSVVASDDCNADGTYSLVLNFNAENFDGYFTVYARNQVYVGNYSISELPLTISNFNLSGFDEDFLMVCLNDTFVECCDEIEWFAPQCDANTDCWEFVYPIILEEFSANGTALITISNEEEFNNIYNADIHNLNYPFQVAIANEFIEVITPNDFFEIGGFENMCD